MINVAFIIISYHQSDYKTLKHFYLDHFCIQHKGELGKLPSYSWLLRLKNRCLDFLSCFLEDNYSQNHEICFVDSTPIPVCATHKVCKEGAERSKSSMGWYYGFKVHTIINHQGEIVRMHLDRATLDDRKGLKIMVNDIKGTIIGDKGYLNQDLIAELAQNDINLITNYRKNMKNKPLYSDFELELLQKRKTIETFFNLIKDKYNLRYIKYRSQIPVFIAVFAAFCSYASNNQKVNSNIDLR